MAKQITMEFKKGDRRVHYFKLPIADYSTGGTLFFAAKPAVDNDTTDAAAVINKSFTDAVVTLDATHATWTLEFLPADIVSVNFTNGETKKKYKGEFQFVPTSGYPVTFPDDDSYIEVTIYADIKRAVA